MSKKDVTLSAREIGEISVDFNRELYVELKDVDSDDVVSEMGFELLLESMSFDEIKGWVEERGYTVTEG